MRVVGLFLVRNEVDVLETNLRHHFATLLDAAIVVDNGSSDGTLQLAAELARELPITLVSEPGEYAQADLVTRMARLAHAQGADWVLPIDADEFWIGTGRAARDVLESCPPEVGVLRCRVTNFVQSRAVTSPRTEDLLTMTMRPPAPIGDPTEAQQLIEDGEIAFVEIAYQRKCVSRATSTLDVHPGNHAVEGFSGSGIDSDEIECLHAPIRARSVLTLKADQGRRVDENSAIPWPLFWHVRRWWRQARDGRLEDEWASNSYADEQEALPHALVSDIRLRDALAPWVSKVPSPEVSAALRLPCSAGAYLLALPEVEGWFSEVDFRLFVEIDRLQQEAGLTGDIFEIGVYCGKSANLLGYFTRDDERLIVCDLFNSNELVSDANRIDNEQWYPDYGRKTFEDSYLRFHTSLPEILACPSTDIDASVYADTCRFVHVDGSHLHAIVRRDIQTARTALRRGGVIALDDISTAHNPGSALASWEAVLTGTLRPVCLTNAKLYGTFDDSIDWAGALEAWASAEPDMHLETHELAGYEVPRVVQRPAVAASPVANLTQLPPLDAAPPPPAPSPPAEPSSPQIGLRELLRRLPGATKRAVRARLPYGNT